MRTLDRYIVRNFLVTAALCFVALMLMRIIGDLFGNIDEFAELKFATTAERLWHMARYYGYQSFAYFIELGGIIIVVSATFTLAKMNHTNELTAMLAAGVSLHRVSLPIVVCAMAMGGLVVLDQELVIPRIAPELIISQDETPDTVAFPVRLMDDSRGSVWFSKVFRSAENSMSHPAVLVRDGDKGLVAVLAGSAARPGKRHDADGWVFSDGRIVSNAARTAEVWPHTQDCTRVWTSQGPLQMLEACRIVYGRDVALDQIGSAESLSVRDETYGMTILAGRFEPDPPPADGTAAWTGRIVKPEFTFNLADGRQIATIFADEADWVGDEGGGGYWKLTGGKMFHRTDLTAESLALRVKGHWMDYMSTSDLDRLMRTQRVSDLRAAETIKHSRFTSPINNLVMLLLALPFILSRERNIKASATLSVLTVGTFFAFVFICRYMGLPPLVGTWMPIFLFGPVAIIMFDSVKT
jgi:hypothetical protein